MNTIEVAGFIVVGSIALYSALTFFNIVVFVIGNRAGNRKNKKCVDENSIEFVIVSKASRSVIDTLIYVIKNIRSRFLNSILWVVVDEGSYGIPRLKRLKRGINFRLVIVPEEYRKGKFKARAMNYFVENFVNDKKWYVFLDDDSYPMDKNFLCELKNNVHIYNGILIPRRGGNLVTWMADSVRYYSDITKHRFALEKIRKPIYGLHGELLIVKGWVLKDIGFETDSVSEDSWFASRIVRRGLLTGQVSTRVSILSPATVRDFAKQRGRWFAGRFRDFIRGEYPPLMSLAYLQELLLALALPAMPFLVFLKIFYRVRINGLIAILGLTSGLLGFLLGVISYSVYHIIERKDYKKTFLVLFLIPIFAFLEGLGVVYGMLNYHRLTKRFVIIDKRIKRTIIVSRENRLLEEPIPVMNARNLFEHKREYVRGGDLYDMLYTYRVRVI